MDENGGRPDGTEEPEAQPGYTDEELKEELRRLLSDDEVLVETLENLPSYARDLLSRAASGDISEEEFLREVFVGDCPRCESSDTVDCDRVEGVEDVTVGLCNECGFTWCLECGVPVDRGEACGHWEICDECSEEKDEYEECGIPPFECPQVVEWMQGLGVFHLAGSGCAWCGAAIEEDMEVFAVGAGIKEGVDFTGVPEDESRFLPVVIGGRIVPAVITSPDSQAKIDGNDVMFMVCSGECAETLKRALEKEKETNDRISLN